MSEQAKLLIVDDELSVRDSLGKWFREEGYVIGAAENGSQALALRGAQAPRRANRWNRIAAAHA